MKFRNILEHIEGNEIKIVGFFEQMMLVEYVRYTNDDLESLNEILSDMKEKKAGADIDVFVELCDRKGIVREAVMETLMLCTGTKRYSYFFNGHDVPEQIFDGEGAASLRDYYEKNFMES